MKTYSAKPTEVKRKWYVIDASQLTLGRLSTIIAQVLTGKNKPMYTSHIDCGDFVVVINSDNLQVTGEKLDKKIYYKHSGYPGGLKERTLAQKIENDSREVIEHAVRGMLPVNKLRAERMKRLKVFKSSNHTHGAQKPEAIDLKGRTKA